MDDVDDRLDRKARCAIAVMAKAPGAGRVKTRLSPFLNPEEAQDLSGCFIRDMTENLRLAAGEVGLDAYVAFAPAGSEPAFGPIAARGTRLVLADGSLPAPPGVEGFGRCLWQAARSLLDEGYGAVGVLNSDSPTLPTSLLVDAVRRLAEPGDRAVLGPSTDGGYYLLAMKSAHANLFRAVDWSTGRVAGQTRARAREIGLGIIELDTWYDVDDSTSLRRLMADIEPRDGQSMPALVPYAAHATAAWLRRHPSLWHRAPGHGDDAGVRSTSAA